MHLTAGGVGLFVTGALFAALVLSGRARRVHLSRVSYALFSIAAVVCVASALVLVTVDQVWYPSMFWLLPVIPLALIVVVVRDASVRSDVVAAVAAVPVEPEEPEEPVAPAETAVPRGSQEQRPSGARSYEWSADDSVARAHAYNPHSSASELAELAYEYPALRPAVAANPATPSAVLEWLAKSGDPVLIAAISSRGASMPFRAIASRRETMVGRGFDSLSRN